MSRRTNTEESSEPIIVIKPYTTISSLMVESEMATHPAVLECCVVGRKHEKWAEVGHAFVVLKQGQSADMETLKAHCRERMSKVRALLKDK